MTILATPQHSQILLINPFLINLSRHFSDVEVNFFGSAFKHLIKGSKKLGVPCFLVVSDASSDYVDRITSDCKIEEMLVFQCSPDRPVLSNGDLVEAMKSEDRMQLFICGFWLDDVVTATALEALTLGFDVRVITDLSFALNDDARDLAMNRFNQYTVAPMSLANLLYEWTTKAENEETRLALHQIWQDHLNANALD